MIPGRRELIVDLAISDAEITARIANAYRAAISKCASSSTLRDVLFTYLVYFHNPWADIPDSQTTAADSPILIQQKTDETKRTLLLKRQRFFDMDAADAEWRINSGTVHLWV